MFRRLLFISVSVIVLFATTPGQEVKKTGGFSRIAGMGMNLYIQDPFFVTINPAWGAVYNDFIFSDLGWRSGPPYSAGGTGQFFAGSFSIGKNFTIGGMLTRNDFGGLGIALVDPAGNINPLLNVPFNFGVVSTVNSLNPSASVVPLDNNVELMGTYKIKNTTLGFGAAYASTTNDVTPDTGSGAVNSASQIGFNAGVLHSFSKKLLLDAGVSLMLPSASYEPPAGSKTEASQTILLVNARAFYNYSPKVSIVPLFVFMNISGGTESGGTNSVSRDLPSVTIIGFGLGANYKVGNFLLAGGASYSRFSLTSAAVDTTFPELSNSVTFFPVWNIGIEWNLLDWLVGRIGYAALTGSVTLETAASSTTVNENVFSTFLLPQRGVSLGIGFRLGDFSIDAIVNEDVLRQGLNNIGGGSGQQGQNAATFAYITFGYDLP